MTEFKSVTAKKPRKPVAKVRKTKAAALERRATKLWGEYIHRRDVVCRVCGKIGRLEAHHILPRTFKATRADPLNGVLLCFSHHKGRDGVHGDPKMAVELYSQLLGVDGYEALREKAWRGVKTSEQFWSAEIKRLEYLLELFGGRHG